jgi:hypothetical protein
MSEQWTFITPEIKKTADNFGRHHWQPGIGLPQGPIYHYTTGDSLIRIIESGELWSTQAACMNDAKELIYAIERLADRAKLQKEVFANNQLGPLWRAFDEFIANPDVTAASVFLTCFSEKDDDLSQWRAYGGGEGGYSIGFDGKKLIELGHSNEVFLFPVDYDESKQNVLLDDVIKWLIELYLRPEKTLSPSQVEAWAVELVRFWLSNVAPFAVIFKHPTFKEEQEWRLWQSLRPDEKKKFRFRQRASLMSRHVPIRIPKLPIVSVRVGPTRHPDPSRIAVGDLLAKHDYALDNIKIEITHVPYRQS